MGMSTRKCMPTRCNKLYPYYDNLLLDFFFFTFLRVIRKNRLSYLRCTTKLAVAQIGLDIETHAIWSHGLNTN